MLVAAMRREQAAVVAKSERELYERKEAMEARAARAVAVADAAHEEGV